MSTIEHRLDQRLRHLTSAPWQDTNMLARTAMDEVWCMPGSPTLILDSNITSSVEKTFAAAVDAHGGEGTGALTTKPGQVEAARVERASVIDLTYPRPDPDQV